MTLLVHNNPADINANLGRPPQSPHQYRQRMEGKGQQTFLATPKPMQYGNSPSNMHQVQPTMRTPEYFTAHRTSTIQEMREPNPVAVEDAPAAAVGLGQDEDAKSDISPLQCGSVPPNPRYNPATDPHLSNEIFVPPVEITIRVRIQTYVQLLEEKRLQQEAVSHPPEWLRLPDTRDSEKKKKKTKTKLQLNDTDDGVASRRRRSRSLTSSDRLKTNESISDLKRSYSEDSPSATSPPLFAMKPNSSPDLYMHTYESPQPETSPTAGSLPQSPRIFNRIVVGKHGRPVYADQEEEDQELLDLPVLPNGGYRTTLEDDREHYAGTGPSISFSDSYQTPPTIYESSSEQHAAVARDGVEIASTSFMQSPSSGPALEQQTPSHPQPRKGMVRREFQRRFFWFNNKNFKKQSNGTSNRAKNKDRTLKTVMTTEWKQTPGRCMV